MDLVKRKNHYLSIGLAIFSMFFGAGNIVFPLILGEYAREQNFFASAGMILSGVLVPLIGMLGMILFQGDYYKFFNKIGRWPGFLLILTILAIIGPFAGIPRCITISYSTFHAFHFPFFDELPLYAFSFLNCALIFLCTYRPGKILDLLGKVLTPILLLSLAVIAVKGIYMMPSPTATQAGSWEVFSRGFVEGYNTMDLLASFFFSSVVLTCLRQTSKDNDSESEIPKSHFTVAAMGAVIAAALLSIVYIAFSSLSAGFAPFLVGVPKHEILGVIAKYVLGPYAGLTVGIAVFFAVFTTEIALTAIFAKFLHEKIFKGKISYTLALVLTLGVAFAVSTLHFDGIAAILGPVLQVCYPAMIVLSVANLLDKLTRTDLSAPLFYGTLAMTLLARLLV
jgi:LIVCS family branched-chain amino acid:cation transporter